VGGKLLFLEDDHGEGEVDDVPAHQERLSELLQHQLEHLLLPLHQLLVLADQAALLRALPVAPQEVLLHYPALMVSHAQWVPALEILAGNFYPLAIEVLVPVVEIVRK
jgi:hypothetical protein